MIEVSNLAKSFGRVRVLNDIGFKVNRGEFVTTFGPSGCGKTTLLRMLACLETPDSGQILLDGLDAFRHSEEYKKRISIVWQDPRLLPWRTAAGNVTFSLEMRHPDLNKGEAKVLTEKALGLVGLLEFAHCLPRQLSGGMRQRINLARALVLDSDIMLMDEPLASLNEITDKKGLMIEISKIWEIKRKTIIYVTHSVSEAVFLSDRIIVLSDKPTNILREVPVPLPRPRNLTSKEATAICNQITELLGGMIA